MTATEAAIRSYWRNSIALFKGSELARKSLQLTEEFYRSDVAKLSNAATRSLLAADMRVGQ